VSEKTHLAEENLIEPQKGQKGTKGFEKNGLSLT
jgi:hypothetical protein